MVAMVRRHLPDPCRSSHSGALNAEHACPAKGRCGSRSQTEDRPHSRTPELSIRQVICVTSALVRFCMSANDPKRTSRAGTLTPHVVRGRCRTRRCASSSALGSAPCRNQATSQRQKVRGRRIANTEEAPVGVPPGLLPMSMRLRPGPAVTQATETLLPRSFEGKRRGRDTTSAYDLGERHQSRKMLFQSFCAAAPITCQLFRVSRLQPHLPLRRQPAL